MLIPRGLSPRKHYKGGKALIRPAASTVKHSLCSRPLKCQCATFTFVIASKVTGGRPPEDRSEYSFFSSESSRRAPKNSADLYGIGTMATSTLLVVSLAALLGVHTVQASHPHPVRPVIAKEPRAESQGTFSVHQTRNPAYRPKSGLEAMVEVYKKYGVELTPQLRKAVEINKHLSTSQKSS